MFGKKKSEKCLEKNMCEKCLKKRLKNVWKKKV